jgi:hypothetical protein
MAFKMSTSETKGNEKKKDSQGTYNVTSRQVRETIAAVQKQ